MVPSGSAREREAASRLMVVCSLLVYCAEFVLEGDLYPFYLYVCVCGCSLCCAEFVLAGDLYPTILLLLLLLLVFLFIIILYFY